MFIVRQQTKNWTPLHAHIYWDWETLIFKIVYWQMPTTILSWNVFGFKNLKDECQYHCWGLLLIKQISQKSKVKKTQDCSNKTMFFNHATDRNTNTRSGIANYWAIPPVSQGATAKNQNWKSSGVRRQCQEKHVRIRAICKLEQISHMAMAFVSCCGWLEILKVFAQSKLDIWIESVRHNWEATLVQHFSASSAYSALSCHGWPGTCGSCASGWEILHSAFLPSGQNFLQPVQQAVVSAA